MREDERKHDRTNICTFQHAMVLSRKISITWLSGDSTDNQALGLPTIIGIYYTIHDVLSPKCTCQMQSCSASHVTVTQVTDVSATCLLAGSLPGSLTTLAASSDCVCAPQTSTLLVICNSAIVHAVCHTVRTSITC